jgi:predicted nucleic acid-binding protein
MPGSFIDTNVLVYLASTERAKADRAEAIVSLGGVISVQILNELANIARRKMRMDWRETRDFLSAVRGLLTVQPVTVETHEAGLAFAERYKLSVYDGMIVAAAFQAGCDVVWSEDMQDGMVLGEGLRIANPFRGAA